ncbi:MAG: hypothetical protein V7637_1609 [Mycobacteriales bacterium]
MSGRTYVSSIRPRLAELRPAVVSMAAVLGSFGTALLMESWAGLHTDVVVLAVALAVTLSRSQRDVELRHQLLGLVELPVVALAASQAGLLMHRAPVLGDALFAVAVSGSIWLRRFGRTAARAGTLLATPFLAMLIVPVPLAHEDARSLWTPLLGALAVGWVVLTRYLAERSGFVRRVPASPGPRVVGGPRAGTPAGRRRLPASTRMAAQMGVALGVAFLVGHLVFPRHWPWVVMTAFIVSSGNRGRGDVVYKAVLRLVGALFGVAAATLLAGAFAPGDKAAIVAIFVTLGVGSWLRSINYAFWAACVTAVLSLLYGYLGESPTALLGGRLLGILLGGVIAIGAAWLVMPVRTTDILRRRTADVLAALSDFLTAARQEPVAVGARRAEFDASLAVLDQLAPTLRAHRLLTRRWRPRPRPADLIDTLHRCRAPVATITRLAAADPAALAGTGKHAGRLARAVGDLRLTLAGRTRTEPPPAPPTGSGAVAAGAVVAGPVVAGPVAAGPVAARPVAVGPVAVGPDGRDELVRAWTELGGVVAELAVDIRATRPGSGRPVVPAGPEAEAGSLADSA